MDPVLQLIRQRADRTPMVRARPGWTPLVFDSPHSGTRYPADFGHACDLATLRRAEDTFVDQLFDFAPALGVAWVEALFPRSYLDVNRGRDEVDVTMLSDGWPGTVPSADDVRDKLRLGKGLVWKLTDEGLPVYDRLLTAAEVAGRIERCWVPYHAALAAAIEDAQARHGWCLHLDCHSMPSVAGSHATAYPGVAHPDFVLGDRDGSTADPRITDRLAAFLRGLGYSVAVNHPYRGVEIVRRHGDPARGRHSVQLEINRRLYMEEASLELHAGCQRLKQDLLGMTRFLLAEAMALCAAGARA